MKEGTKNLEWTKRDRLTHEQRMNRRTAGHTNERKNE